MTTITPAQQRVLDFVRAFISEKGFPPTRTEISKGLGYLSANAAELHLQALQKQGVVALTRGVSRGIRILEPA